MRTKELVDVMDFAADPARLERILASDRWKIKSKEIIGAVEFGSIEDSNGNVRLEYENTGIYKNTYYDSLARNIKVILYGKSGPLFTVEQTQFWKNKSGKTEREIFVYPPFRRPGRQRWTDDGFILASGGVRYEMGGKMNPAFRAKGMLKTIDAEATVAAFIDKILSGRFNRPELIRPKRKRVGVTS